MDTGLPKGLYGLNFQEEALHEAASTLLWMEGTDPAALYLLAAVSWVNSTQQEQ